MKFPSRFACAALLACAAIPAVAQTGNSTPYVYLISQVNQPWGQSTNEDAMNNILGSGNWVTQNYETVDPNALLVSSTQFIFMEGGDSSFAGFQDFMNHNGAALYTWIYNGGRLLIMSAPNDPLVSATVYLPDNIVLRADSFYGSTSTLAYATQYSNQIFHSPNSTSYVLTGDFVSHGYFTPGGNNQLLDLMQSDLGEVVLGYDLIGGGIMLYGGLTTDNFQLPQPAAHSFLENIVSYTVNVTLTPPTPPSTPGS